MTGKRVIGIFAGEIDFAMVTVDGEAGCEQTNEKQWVRVVYFCNLGLAMAEDGDEVGGYLRGGRYLVSVGFDLMNRLDAKRFDSVNSGAESAESDQKMACWAREVGVLIGDGTSRNLEWGLWVEMEECRA